MGQLTSWITKNLPSDQRQGSGQNDESNKPQSLWGMLLTLGPVLVVAAVYITFFLIFRGSQRRYYSPRTYIGGRSERSPEMPRGMFNWFGAFWKIPDSYTLRHQTLDAFLFIRYLKICTIICFVSACITWPILFPVNATGMGGQEQLEILSYSNVSVDKSPNRFFAHVFVAWVVYGFLMFMITRECIYYINLRQAYLMAPHYAKRISARTVIFTAVPKEFLDEAKIRRMFNNAVKNVWIAGNTKELEKKVEERDKIAMKLEGAEVKLIKAVNKARNKAQKKGGDTAAEENNTEETAAVQDTETGDAVTRWLPAKKRPSHRLGLLGLVGKKVDTLEWCRSELETKIPEIEKEQDEWKQAGKFDKVGAIFVEFHTQADAQAAYQVVTHHHALHMSPKAIGVTPQDVIWKSLSIPWWQLIIRRYAVYAFIGALIIFWAIPVAIVGVISQVSLLINLPGLTWLQKIPEKVLGIISGLLPSVALSILMSFVPIIMRGCAKLAGAKTMTEAELFTQNAYFCFQVLQVFLIRSITDAASGALVTIAQHPDQVFTLLGNKLPTTSNFYISYFILQGVAIAVGVLTQVVGLFIFRLMYKYLAGTPRAKYNKWVSLSAILWGSLLPVYTNIVCISIVYSVIAPLILFWSTLALGLFYLAYRYNLLFVSTTAVDTQGLIYPRALKQLFVGIYLAEICMIGLFAVVKAPGPAVLMAVFLVFTILYHITMTRSLNPLLYGLPRSLEMAEADMQARLAQGESESGASKEATGTNGINGVDADVNGEKNGEKSVPASNDYGEHKKEGNLFTRFLKPWLFADFATLRHQVPRERDIDFAQLYGDNGDITERNAYFPPCATTEPPHLWIPRDPAGVSRQEIALTSKVIPISDSGASLDEKAGVKWSEDLDDVESLPPIFQKKVYY